MIIEVKEVDYMGFHLECVKGLGWKIVLHDVEYLFRTMQDAQVVCDQFQYLAKSHGGKKVIPNK